MTPDLRCPCHPNTGTYWALFVCDDRVYRCRACRDKGVGKITPMIVAKAELERIRRQKNLCVKCGKPAQYYGPVGGYSAKCEECNKLQAVARRAASARGQEA